MKQNIFDKIKQRVLEEYDLVSDSGMSFEFKDSDSYHYTLRFYPIGKPYEEMGPQEREQYRLSYTE